MVYLILSVIGVLSVLLLKTRWRFSRQLVFVVGLLLSGIVVYIAQDFARRPEVIEKGALEVLAAIPWREVSLYLVMIAGMASKYIYDMIDAGNGVSLQKWQFIKPICVSPIVFASVYTVVGKESSTVLLLLFAFQNGFFWQSILYKNNEERLNKGIANK